MRSWKLGRREKEAVLSVASFTKRDDNSASYHVCKIMIVMPLISIIISHIPSLILIIQKSKCSWRFVTSTQEKPTQSCWRSCFSVCLPAAGSSLRILFICSWTGKTPPQRLKQSFTSVLLSITKQLHNYTTARQYWGVGVFQLFVQFAVHLYSSSFCFLELWQDGQISADELQRCLTQSGMAGSYKRKETRLCFEIRYTLTTLNHCKRGTNRVVSCYIKCDVLSVEVLQFFTAPNWEEGPVLFIYQTILTVCFAVWKGRDCAQTK